MKIWQVARDCPIKAMELAERLGPASVPAKSPFTSVQRRCKT
jgi:hypothetical protein